jgi:hypothetical protein
LLTELVKVYAGLHRTMRRQPQFSGPILEILLPHAMQFFDPDPELPPLNLSRCVDPFSTVAKEPLPNLIQCLQECALMHLDDDGTDDPESEHAIERSADTEVDRQAWKRHTTWGGVFALVSDLADILSEYDLEEFELTKRTEYSMETVAGRENLTRASLLMGTFEALIDFSIQVLSRHADDEERCAKLVTTIIGLHSQMEKLRGEVGGKSASRPAAKSKKKAGGKKGDKGGASQTASGKEAVSLSSSSLLKKKGSPDADITKPGMKQALKIPELGESLSIQSCLRFMQYVQMETEGGRTFRTDISY